MPLIRLREVTKIYWMGTSQVRALDGVTLEIEKGEFVSITGPSGSGKSTMMHIIGCLDRPTTGSYEFNGQAVNKMGDWQRARIRNQSIGFVFQTFNLINRQSALSNVAVPLLYAGRADMWTPAREALQRVGLASRAKHRPNELSGGERQRVAIARAIVNRPSVLVADEPTGNLDTRTGEQIMGVFKRLHQQGTTIVLVTHERHIADQAQRVIAMLDGKITEDTWQNRATNDHNADNHQPGELSLAAWSDGSKE
jgi:putative ABC transport system ATP-binding protein